MHTTEQHERTIVDGRLIPNKNASGFHFSLIRVLSTLSIIAFFAVSHDSTAPNTTNYGLFSIRQMRTSSVMIQIAGVSIRCPHDDPFYAPVCNLMQKHMTHEQPLVYNANDRPYTTHRMLCWTLIGLTLFGFIFTCNYTIQTKSLLLNAVMDLFVLNPSQLVQLLLQLSTLVYPMWERLEFLIVYQHPDSLFARLGSLNKAYTASVALLLVLAIGANALSRLLTKSSFLLGRSRPMIGHALVAVCLGYCRGATAKSLYDDTVHLLYGASATNVTWTYLIMVAIAAVRSKLFLLTMALWYSCNVLAAMVGEYQFQQQVLPVVMNQMKAGLENFLQGVEKWLGNNRGDHKF
jgi:hypothetical protein